MQIGMWSRLLIGLVPLRTSSLGMRFRPISIGVHGVDEGWYGLVYASGKSKKVYAMLGLAIWEV